MQVTDYSKDFDSLTKAQLLSLRDLTNAEVQRLEKEVSDVRCRAIIISIKLEKFNGKSESE